MISFRQARAPYRSRVDKDDLSGIGPSRCANADRVRAVSRIPTLAPRGRMNARTPAQRSPTPSADLPSVCYGLCPDRVTTSPRSAICVCGGHARPRRSTEDVPALQERSAR
jgi:hypothetical protein